MAENFFIIGCNRSGTSLLRTILNHHSQVAVPLESIFLIDYLKATDKVDLEIQKRFLRAEPMLEEWGVKLSSRDLAKIKNTPDLINTIHQKYAKLKKKKIWGNKTPRLTICSEQLKLVLGKVKFVHLVRDPRAVSLSLTQSTIHRSNIYYGARRWNRHVGAALALEKKFPKAVLRIYFEELVADPKKELKKICKFLGIRFEKKMLEYQKTGNREYRKYHKGAHTNLTKKPDPHVADYWKDSLSKKEIGIIEAVCRKLMPEFGYQPILKKSKLSVVDVNYYRLHRIYGFSLQTMRYVLFWPKYLFHTLWRKVVFGSLIEEVTKINY